MPREDRAQTPARMGPRKWVLVCGMAAGVVVLAAAAVLVWTAIAENRRKARAEEAAHTALKKWCSDEPLDRVRETKSGDFFDEFVSRISS